MLILENSLKNFFTLLGKHTLGAHLFKDFTIIDTLLLRFEEEYISMMDDDQVIFLKRMNEIYPDAQNIIQEINLNLHIMKYRVFNRC